MLAIILLPDALPALLDEAWAVLRTLPEETFEIPSCRTLSLEQYPGLACGLGGRGTSFMLLDYQAAGNVIHVTDWNRISEEERRLSGRVKNRQGCSA